MKKVVILFVALWVMADATAQTIPVNSGLTVAGQQSVDGKAFKIVSGKHVPWASSAEYLATIVSTRRHIGQIAYIDNGTSVDVWQFVGGIANINFKSLTDTIKVIGPTLVHSGDSLYINLKSASVSQSLSAATTIVVTFGGTQPDANYRVVITPTSTLAETAHMVTTKTTTTFTVTYASPVTGTVSFDWVLTR